ncbi:hypothetical protein Tco_1045663 [Tanacetum coccineum]|uniref:CCHC-type domain-containing protein n=1 Tax=Tanacetum coccineum TaxID=301880 RepID=A0ABQ5GVW7_9ASTR
MPPRMRTRSAGRPAAESLGGGTGVRVGRGGRGRRPKENVRNVIVNGKQMGYSYKKFLACAQRIRWKPEIRTLSREVAISMSWNDFKFMMIQEFCPCHEMQKLEFKLWNKLWSGLAMLLLIVTMSLASLVPHLVTPRVDELEKPTVRACYECGSTDHARPACPRWNRAQGPGENHPNQVAASNGGHGRGNQGN